MKNEREDSRGGISVAEVEPSLFFSSFDLVRSDRAGTLSKRYYKYVEIAKRYM